jgi:hypothetical protein
MARLVITIQWSTIKMRAFAKVAARRASWRFGSLCVILLSCICSIPRAHAAATLFLEEPYSYDGAFAGTGHSAVYLSNVCATSPVVLRPCASDESGVVLSRYDGIAGYDWIAIPLTPYLYAVEQPDAVPLFADAKLVAFLRDQYRRQHLEALAPDRPDGGTPNGNWYELVGASYDRTIYGFEIETSPAQDALLISKFNAQPNRQRYNFVARNCADFGRQIINFYYPHAVHRSLLGDLGITTPKQIAKMMAKYSRNHPQLESSTFLIAQVPGTVARSKPIHGGLESIVAAKKYMLPLFLLQPYVAGGLVAGHLGVGRWDPARHAPILDSRHQLDVPITRADRRSFQSRLDELSRTGPINDSSRQAKNWEHLQAAAEPKLNSSGQPVVEVRVGSEAAQVGISRGDILNAPESSEFAARLLEARLYQELRPAAASKTARGDVENDLALLQQLLSVRPRGSADTVSSINDHRTRLTSDSQ